MDLTVLYLVVGVLAGIPVLYKVLPYREMSREKPGFSFLPKFKTQIALPASVTNAQQPMEELAKLLSQSGFKKKSEKGQTAKFTRGHLLGDISIKLVKIKLLVKLQSNNSADLCIMAAWVAAFDTGDFWVFLNELKNKFETGQTQ